MTRPTPAQLAKIRKAADNAYNRISNTVAFDPDLAKLDMAGLSDFISRAQGALLDLTAAIDAIDNHTAHIGGAQ